MLGRLCPFYRAGDDGLSHSPRSEEVVIVGNYLVCMVFNEVTHVLDTQFQTYHDPVETRAPPERVNQGLRTADGLDADDLEHLLGAPIGALRQG